MCLEKSVNFKCVTLIFYSDMQNVSYLRSSISWVFNLVTFFDLRDILSVLSKHNYKTVPTPIAPVGVRVGGEGIIAFKDDSSIYVDTHRKIIGVNGSFSPSKLVPALQDLKSVIAKEFNIDFSRDLRYCELISEFRVKSDNAINKIGNIPFIDLSPLTPLVGECRLVGFRIGSATSLPTHDDWFDINIHPTWSDPAGSFTIAVVYRNKSEEKVLKISENFESLVSTLIKLIEG